MWGTRLAMTNINNKLDDTREGKKCYLHRFGHWDMPIKFEKIVKIADMNEYMRMKRLIQIRQCLECGEAETRYVL